MMKNTMPYLIVIAATFLLSGAVVVGTLLFRPDLLKGNAMRPGPRDSIAAERAPLYSRASAGPSFEELGASLEIGRDSLAIMRDSVRALLASLDQERNRSRGGNLPEGQQPTAQPAVQPAVIRPVTAQPAAPDSTGLKLQKTRAKMLESMPAEDAAKILVRLSDDETRALLQYIKARQAAKILAALEPERASRLLR